MRTQRTRFVFRPESGKIQDRQNQFRQEIPAADEPDPRRARHQQLEQIQLLKLCEEIIDDLKYMDHFQMMKFDLKEIRDTQVYSDRLRMKMILNNLFSNAIKFQKRRSGQNPLL